MKRTTNFIMGFICIVVGGLYLLKTTNRFNIMEYLDLRKMLLHYWSTVFMIVPGILLHFKFFVNKEKDATILFPAGFLVFAGITCQLATWFDMWRSLWPGFILAVAFGLFELYLHGKREKGVLVGVVALAGVSSVFFSRNIFNTSNKEYIIPFFLILLGIIIIFGNGFNSKKA